VVRGPYLGVKARDEWREVRMSDERAGFLERSERRARSESSKISSLGKSQRDFESLHPEPCRGVNHDRTRRVFLSAIPVSANFLDRESKLCFTEGSFLAMKNRNAKRLKPPPVGKRKKNEDRTIQGKNQG